MTAGDIVTVVATVDDDGTKLAAAMASQGAVVADDITMCSTSGNKVVVLVIKAA